MYERLFSNTGLSLERLRTFCEIAEAGGITRAAKGKPHGQSQYSRQLKELESYFAVELFKRSGKSIQITEPGKRLLLLSKQFFTTLDAIVGDFRNFPRTISIGAGESILNWLVLPRFEELEKILPNSRIQLLNLRSQEVNSGVLEGTLDLGIVRANACSNQLDSYKLGILKYCLFVPRRMYNRIKTTDSVQLLKSLPLAQLYGDGEFNEMLAKVADRKRINLNTRLTCSSFPSMKEAVKRGRVASVLPTIAEAELPRTDFEKVSVDLFSALDRQFVLCFNKRLTAVRGHEERTLEKLAKLFVMP